MKTGAPSPEDIRRKAAAAAFGKRLITNIHRGLVVEAIVACALEPDWCWCSQDYSSWDFERSDGLRLEVKQSAARQSWAEVSAPPSRCSFDIAARTGRYESGSRWVGEPGRNAHIYVLAHHPIFDATADHTDSVQWRFYVIPAKLLPATDQIALSRVRSLAEACSFADLPDAVLHAASVVQREAPLTSEAGGD